ncbi:MAG: exonuclease domain-containing protein [Aquabacterium sp.]|nr:exonuclease domain-containing protein [Aquabacterium sp.]
MTAALFQPMVFVDLETTGSNGNVDRITELGVVEIDENGEVSEWSSLVNPQVPIPAFIQGLTGISDAMVAGAPVFADLADEVFSRLQGRLFVAHNARFDYGFLKCEFKRLGLDFKAPVLCTVKLSRHLYPQFKKHSLDALIERHQLSMPARHRALADAAALRQFWHVLQMQIPAGQLADAVSALTGRSTWPAHLDMALLDALPECHGAYLFFGEGDSPLYIGKSNNVRQQVLAHLHAGDSLAKGLRLAEQVRRVEWVEMPGEMGSLLKEAELIKLWQPLHNKRLRRTPDLCTWRLVSVDQAGEGSLKPELAWARDVNWGAAGPVYGLFSGQRDAIKTLREMAETAQLCLATLGVDVVPMGQPCAGYLTQQCSGACVGKETWLDHSQRLRTVMSDWQVTVWPYAGPVKVKEGVCWHVIDAWCYLGTAEDEAGVEALRKGARPVFDKDTYKILVSWLPKMTVTALKSLSDQ